MIINYKNKPCLILKKEKHYCKDVNCGSKDKDVFTILYENRLTDVMFNEQQQNYVIKAYQIIVDKNRTIIENKIKERKLSLAKQNQKTI